MTGIRDLVETFYQALLKIKKAIFDKIDREAEKTNLVIADNTAALKVVDEHVGAIGMSVEQQLGRHLAEAQRFADTAAARSEGSSTQIAEGLAALNSGISEIRSLLTQQGGDASGTGPLLSKEQLDELGRVE